VRRGDDDAVGGVAKLTLLPKQCCQTT